MPFTGPKWIAHDVADWDSLRITNGNSQDISEATAMLINMTVAIGVSKITRDNADEVWRRIAIWQALFGSYLTDLRTDEPIFLTKSDIDRHIGIETEAKHWSFSEFCELIRKKPLGVDPKQLPAQVANKGRALLEICAQ